MLAIVFVYEKARQSACMLHTVLPSARRKIFVRDMLCSDSGPAAQKRKTLHCWNTSSDGKSALARCSPVVSWCEASCEVTTTCKDLRRVWDVMQHDTAHTSILQSLRQAVTPVARQAARFTAVYNNPSRGLTSYVACSLLVWSGLVKSWLGKRADQGLIKLDNRLSCPR